MKRKLALSLALLGAASAFAGGGDLYATKGCHQEYNGYWGFGAGWNSDHNDYRLTDYTAAHEGTAAETYKFTAKENKSSGVGHLFLGYSFYNDMPYSVAIEAGAYSKGKEASKTKVVVSDLNNSEVIRGKAERQPAYYLALKPRYNSGDWWVNLTLGAAATSFRVKGDFYNATTVAGATMANLGTATKDGFTTYGWMLGLGVGMWFNPNWAISLDYDYMNWSKESSKTVTGYSAGVVTSYIDSAVRDGSASHFVTLNLKNNFNWFA